MSHTIRFSSLGSDINCVISEYITELDYRYLILTNKIIRNEFLRKNIWKRYKKYLMPFLSYLSNFFEQNASTTTYPIRTKLYKAMSKRLNKIEKYGRYSKYYDFCSQYWINRDLNEIHIKSMYGNIPNYMNDITILSLNGCIQEELMFENEKIVTNGYAFDIINGDHLGLDCSYSIAVLHCLKYIHIFRGTTPLNLMKYMMIPIKLLNEFIDITCFDQYKITYSYPFLVVHDTKQICVVNITPNLDPNSEPTHKRCIYPKFICPSTVRIYSMPACSGPYAIFMHHNRGHLLSLKLSDPSHIMHIFSLDLTMGSTISLTCVFTASFHNHITNFIHSSINNKICCSLNKSGNVWLIGDYSESKIPLTINDLIKIPSQEIGSFEISWIANNRYSYPIFLNITNRRKEYYLEFCSEF